MLSLHDYLRAPCAALSIPYWKAQTVQVPPDMRIVHDRDFDAAAHPGFTDEAYFRLMHDLQSIAPVEGGFICRVAGEADLPLLAEIINRSYDELSVTEAQLQGYRKTAVFAADLWLIALEAQSGVPVGCGIADFDHEAREGVLEWIQVLPEHRRRGAGRFIVQELLRRMAGRADFATVSGRVSNQTNPERLYRRCGFTGEDVWHILVRS